MSFFNAPKTRIHQEREFLGQMNALLSANARHSDHSIDLVLQSLEPFCESNELELVLDILLKAIDPEYPCFLSWMENKSDGDLVLCSMDNESSGEGDQDLFVFQGARGNSPRSFLENKRHFGLVCHYLCFLASLLARRSLDPRSKLVSLWILSRLGRSMPTGMLVKVLPGTLSSLFKFVLQYDGCSPLSTSLLAVALQALGAFMLRQEDKATLGQALKLGITNALLQSLLRRLQSFASCERASTIFHLLLRFMLKLHRWAPYEFVDTTCLFEIAFYIGFSKDTTPLLAEESLLFFSKLPEPASWILCALEPVLQQEPLHASLEAVSLCLLLALLPCNALTDSQPRPSIAAALKRVSESLSLSSSLALLRERWSAALLVFFSEEELLQGSLLSSDEAKACFLMAREKSDPVCQQLLARESDMYHKKQEWILEWCVESLLDAIDEKREMALQSESTHEHEPNALLVQTSPVSLDIRNLISHSPSSIWNPIAPSQSSTATCTVPEKQASMVQQVFFFLESRPALLRGYQFRLLLSCPDWIAMASPQLQACLLRKENWPCLSHVLHERLSAGNLRQALDLFQFIISSQSRVELHAFVKNESQAFFTSISLLLACSKPSQLPALALQAFEFLRLLYSLLEREPEVLAAQGAENIWVLQSVSALRHHLSHENVLIRVETCRLLALSALPCLPSYEPERSVQAGLLSLVHTLWAPCLTCIYHCQSSVELSCALDVVLGLIRVGGQEFIASRMRKELWPSLIRLLAKLGSTRLEKESRGEGGQDGVMIFSTTEIQLASLPNASELYDRLNALILACPPSLQQSLLLYREAEKHSAVASHLARGLDFLACALYGDAFFPILNHGRRFEPPAIQTAGIQLKPIVFDREWTRFMC